MTDSVTLAIETSQRVGGVAARFRGDVHVEMLRAPTRHDDDLLPAIDRLFARLDASPRQITAVGVSIGPGGFTGLRIAVSTARMFAEALGSAVYAVPSAMVAAQSHDGPGPIVVALAGKADTFWAARLVRGERWQIVERPGVITVDEVPLGSIEAVLADAHFPAAARQRCEQSGVQVIEPVFDPAACLKITERMIAANERTDPLRLVPWYPRQPEAVTNWERRAGR